MQRLSSIAPASTSINSLSMSGDEILFMRPTSKISPSGDPNTAPPTRLVLPPCGTMGIDFLLQNLRTFDTCSVVLGLATAIGFSPYKSNQSLCQRWEFSGFTHPFDPKFSSENYANLSWLIPLISKDSL